MTEEMKPISQAISDSGRILAQMMKINGVSDIDILSTSLKLTQRFKLTLPLKVSNLQNNHNGDV